jgi:hypothetical protein
MAPHDTNTEKEARRHAVPLVAMGVCLVIVLLGFLWWLSVALQGREGEGTIPTEEQPSMTEPAN